MFEDCLYLKSENKVKWRVKGIHRKKRQHRKEKNLTKKLKINILENI